MRTTMMRAMVMVIGISLVACSSEDPVPKQKDQPKPKQPPVTQPAAPPPVPQPPPEPEPTTQEEITKARKEAMLAGRDDKILKYCALDELVVGEKKEPQAVLGCVIAGCRVKDVNQAREYAKSLPKNLLKQAGQACKGFGIPL